MIRFIDVYKEYDNGTKALKGVNMRIDDGEFVFLVGPSGSGKSTIIKLITGEIALTQGKLMVNGYSMSNISPKQVPLMRRTLGIIFQDFRLIEKKTVYENLSFAMRAIGASSRDLKRRIPYVLQLVGLEQKADRYFPIGLSVPIGVEASGVTFLDRVYHAVLPALTLSITGVSNIALHTREKMIDVMQSDYVLFARMRGEKGWRLFRYYGFRNVLLPAVTLHFASISEIFGGSVT